MSDSSQYDVAVVGGGPAGLMAAIAAGGRGRRVVVIEQLDRLGARLLATGGGRCNLTNTRPINDFLAAYGRQGRFAQPALEALSPAALRALLADLGVATVEDGWQVYPATHKALTVQSALVSAARGVGAELRTSAPATGLLVEAGRVAGVRTAAGAVAARAVIIACGGRSYPALGGTGGGYELARQAGHEIVEPTPALVPLIARERWPARCAGVSAAARVWVDLAAGPAAALTKADRARLSRAMRYPGGTAGDVLFTHRGLSGPAVLDLSGDVAGLLAALGEVTLRLDLAGGGRATATAQAAWVRNFERWQQQAGRRSLRPMLAEHVPAALASVLCELANIDGGIRLAQVPLDRRRLLAELLTHLPVTITQTEGWERASVTRGGVSLREVEPRTLASRRVPGLFLAGEVLDIDGPCGGWNLQWAFASGFLAGSNAGAAQ